MTAKDTLQQTYNLLTDEYDEDPRSPLMLALSRLIDAADDVPTGEIELSANLSPGGVAHVHDQYGRAVAGVKSVAVFQDQTGAPVFQVTL